MSTSEAAHASVERSNSATSLQNSYCCKLDEVLQNGKKQRLQGNTEKRLITVIYAQKTQGEGGGFIVYCIRTDSDYEVKRRYSDFETLRKALCVAYPNLVVPPIPEKHSLAAYATKQTRAKDDIQTIEKRKRMLGSFLNRVFLHPILSVEHLFHQFLDPDTDWSYVCASKVLQLKNSSSRRLSFSITTVKHPDPKFLEADSFTKRFGAHLKSAVYKPHKASMKELSEIGGYHTDLGSTFNGLSLSEVEVNPSLSHAEEEVGIACENTYQSITDHVNHVEESLHDPLREYIQFAEVIKTVLKERSQKESALEANAEMLYAKQNLLVTLENEEKEYERIQNELMGMNTKKPVEEIATEGEVREEDLNIPPASNQNNSGRPDVSSITRRSVPAKNRSNVINIISTTINNFIETDPVATRRVNIEKTRKKIEELQTRRESMLDDMAKFSTILQLDLDRFQKEKVDDMKKILLEYAKNQRRYFEKGVSIWESAQEAVVKIDLENLTI